MYKRGLTLGGISAGTSAPQECDTPNPFELSTYRVCWLYKLQSHPSAHYYLRIILRSILFTFCLYILNLEISCYYSFAALYSNPLKSWPVLAGLFGICYFIGGFGLVLPTYISRLEELSPLFISPGNQYSALCRDWLTLVLNMRLNLKWSINLAILVIPLGNVLWVHFDDLPNEPFGSQLRGLVSFMPDKDWYSEPLAPILVILSLIGFFVLSSIAISSRFIFLHVGLMRAIGKLPLATFYSVPLAVLLFRSLTNSNLFIAVNYSVGVLLLVTIADLHSRIVVSILALLIAFSMLIVIVPYLYLVRRINTEARLLIKHLSAKYIEEATAAGNGARDKSLHDLLDMINMVTRLPIGMYELKLGLGNVIATAVVAGIIGYVKVG